MDELLPTLSLLFQNNLSPLDQEIAFAFCGLDLQHLLFKSDYLKLSEVFLYLHFEFTLVLDFKKQVASNHHLYCFLFNLLKLDVFQIIFVLIRFLHYIYSMDLIHYRLLRKIPLHLKQLFDFVLQNAKKVCQLFQVISVYI